MNKKMNVLLLASLISTSVVATHAFAADTGTITFNGAITDTTCNVDIDGKGADSSVTLPTVSTQNLSSATKVTGKTQFNMALSGCTGKTLNTAKAFFQAGVTVSPEGRLKNTNASGSKNVTLQLRDGSDDSVIKVGDQTQTTNAIGWADIKSGSAKLPYFVEYYAEGAAEAGALTSQVTYNLTYN